VWAPALKRLYAVVEVLVTAWLYNNNNDMRTTQCSGLEIRSVLMESPRPRVADRPRSPSREHAMQDLRSVIQRLRANDASNDCWLYIAGDAKDLTLDTEADFGCPEVDEDTDEQIDPPGFGDRGLWSTIDKQTVDDCIEWADRLAEKPDDAAAANIIRYYIRFDAWPETLNAPDPPPADETLRHLDREFCEKLGLEDSTRRCRREGCSRGTIKLSVFCRRHHFEEIRGRPYPFDD
jgi:hypothetical protein